jgi:hypothetical protein
MLLEPITRETHTQLVWIQCSVAETMVLFKCDLLLKDALPTHITWKIIAYDDNYLLKVNIVHFYVWNQCLLFVWFVTNFLPVGDPKKNKKEEAVNHTKVFVCWIINWLKVAIFLGFLEQKFEITFCSTTIGEL